MDIQVRVPQQGLSDSDEPVAGFGDGATWDSKRHDLRINVDELTLVVKPNHLEMDDEVLLEIAKDLATKVLSRMP